jgi:hypothetical protein
MSDTNEITGEITWESYDHPHEEKSAEWYAIVWIAALAAFFVFLIFGNILLGLLCIVATATLTLLASRPVPMSTYTVDDTGLRIGHEHIAYRQMLSYEFVDRGHDHLLVIDTKKALNPHLLVPIDDEMVDEVKAHFAAHEHLPKHERGIPLSHTVMELIGL